MVEVITMDGAIIAIGETWWWYSERSRPSRAAFSGLNTPYVGQSCYAYREAIDALVRDGAARQRCLPWG